MVFHMSNTSLADKFFVKICSIIPFYFHSLVFVFYQEPQPVDITLHSLHTYSLRTVNIIVLPRHNTYFFFEIKRTLQAFVFSAMIFLLI